MTREDVARLSKEEKNQYLINWLTRKPTSENAIVVMMMLAVMPKSFFDYMLEGILESLAMDKEEPTKENIKEYVDACVESWMCDLEDFYEYIGYYIEAKQPKRLTKVIVVS